MIWVNVSYVKDFNVPVGEILDAERVISEQTSLNKRSSATKPTSSKVGILVGNYIKSMSDSALSLDPDFTQDPTYKWPKGFPQRKAPTTDGNSLGEDKTWDEEEDPYHYPSVGVLHMDEFRNYCKDPLHEKEWKGLG